MGLGLKMGNIIGKTVISLGTFFLGYETIHVWKTIDIKPYSLNCRNLTISNFIIGGIEARVGGNTPPETYYSLSSSYNSSSGILTVGGGYYDGGRWWYPTVSVWLVE